MQIHGFNKTTLLDYPKHIAATIFLGGCNYRCPFCHNASLVKNPSELPIIPEDEVLSLLSKRKHILEGVCITGGEPTLHKELPGYIRKIKEMKLKVKLDTNGNNPDMLRYLISNKLVDYVAIDIKNSLEKYGNTVGLKNFKTDQICESVTYLMNSNIPYEFRTTVVAELHTQSDFIEIGEWIKGAKCYYLQNYKDSGDTILPGLSSCSKEELENFKQILVPYVETVNLRGVD